jgi:polyisoprenoid-binding protein YceI
MSHAPSPADTGREFMINVPESRVEFLVGSAVGDVHGVFKGWTGARKVASVGHPETATFGVNVSTLNMTTGSGTKDKMIKGKDSSYVEKFPSITFTSTQVVPSSDPNKSGWKGIL